MPRLFFAFAMALLFNSSFAQNQGNYILIIDNDSVYIDLGKEFEYQPKGGKSISIELVQPAELTYADELVAFKYDKDLSVSKSEIEVGVDQIMILNSTGNGFMLQTYRAYDPSSFTDFMMNEITKESVSYGYAKKEKPFKKKLKSGHTIEGIQSTLTYRGETEVYTVAAYGGKDQGVLVITMFLSEEFPEDEDMIELFLNSLELKM